MNISIIYMAGLFDGEGTVTLSRGKKNEFRRPIISISSTTFELMQFARDTFGGCISKHRVSDEHYKESWNWRVKGNTAIELAQMLLPYIKEPEKVRRCNMLTHEYKSVTPRNGKYTKEKRQAKIDFEKRFFKNSTHKSLKQ